MARKHPVLRGFVVGKCITVFCPNCDDWHVHGWMPGERRPSHRHAHCTDLHGKSMFEERGYYVAPFTKEAIRLIIGPSVRAANNRA